MITPRLSATRGGGGPPSFEVCFREAELAAVFVEDPLVLLGGVAAESGVIAGVPLLHPRHDLSEAGEQRRHPGRIPAVGVGAANDEHGEGVRLLAVRPAGPAEEERLVTIGTSTQVGDEALLGNVQLAAVLPVGRLTEVRAGVLVGDRNVEPLPSAVFFALHIPAFEPRRALAETVRVLVALSGQVGHVLLVDDARDDNGEVSVTLAEVVGGVEVGDGDEVLVLAESVS